jgi:hypothetical protein
MDSPLLPAAHRGLSLTVLAVLVATVVAATAVVVWFYLDAALVAVPVRGIQVEAPLDAAYPVSEGFTRLYPGTSPTGAVRGS